MNGSDNLVFSRWHLERNLVCSNWTNSVFLDNSGDQKEISTNLASGDRTSLIGKIEKIWHHEYSQSAEVCHTYFDGISCF